MKKNSVLIFLIVNVFFNLYSTRLRCYCSETLKQKIESNQKLMNVYGTPENAFIRTFEKLLESDYNGLTSEGIRIFGIENGENLITEEEYVILFKRKLNQNYFNKDEKISGPIEKQYRMELSFTDSICRFYGITREELLEIRKQKTIINKRKKEIKNIFNECLEMINKKYNEERMAELVAKKLMEKQNQNNGFPVPTVPTLPITTEYGDILAAPVYESGL